MFSSMHWDKFYIKENQDLDIVRFPTAYEILYNILVLQFVIWLNVGYIIKYSLP
jgi:hypothetical protein